MSPVMVSITALFGGWLESGLRVEAALAAGFFAAVVFGFALGVVLVFPTRAFFVVAFFATVFLLVVFLIAIFFLSLKCFTANHTNCLCGRGLIYG
jgi:hypothetical protein